MINRSSETNANSADGMQTDLVKSSADLFLDSVGTLSRVYNKPKAFQNAGILVTHNELKLCTADLNTEESSHGKS